MPITHCPGCRGENLHLTPSDQPGFFNRLNKSLSGFRTATCLDCGLISHYQLGTTIDILRRQKGLKTQSCADRDEL